VGAGLVEPEHRRGAGRAGAVTASLTQSRTASSLVWQARQMSPSSTSCSSRVVPSSSTTRTVPAAGSRRSCRASRTPRPSAPSARRWGRCPWWSGRRRRCLAELDRLAVQRGVARVGDDALASCCSSSAFHIWPESRITTGIDASMMMSEGTCRLVMPRLESTWARPGRSRRRPRCRPRSRPASAGRSRGGSRLAIPSFGLTPSSRGCRRARRTGRRSRPGRRGRR
jgi:hypothetical protein